MATYIPSNQNKSNRSLGTSFISLSTVRKFRVFVLDITNSANTQLIYIIAKRIKTSNATIFELGAHLLPINRPH